MLPVGTGQVSGVSVNGGTAAVVNVVGVEGPNRL